MLKFITVILFSLLLSVNAIVWDPKITLPKSGTVWRAGGTYTVQWDPTVDGQLIPDSATGMIKLGYLEGTDSNEHLYWDLAQGFKLNQGAQKITLPSDLDFKTSYIIVLMGDSGNASPKFTIKAAST